MYVCDVYMHFHVFVYEHVCVLYTAYVCVLYLLREHMFLRLQRMAMLQTLVAAGLGVATVLKRASLLLQTHHLVLAHTAQVSVQLPHRQAHQLLVGETIVHCALPTDG